MVKYVRLIFIILVCAGIATWFILAGIYIGLLFLAMGSIALIKLWRDQHNNSKE